MIENVSRSAPNALPFDGLRVVEVADGLAGPVCGLYLADLGAQVLKLELDDGDRACRWGRGDEAIFRHFNRNKALRAGSLRGLADEIASAPLAEADVFSVHLDASDRARARVDWQALATDASKRIVCEISDLGRRGPFAEHAASELTLQALSGMTRYLGTPGDRPVRIGAEVASMAAGMAAFQAIVAALLARDRDRCGQYVHVCALRALLSMKSALLAAQSAPDAWAGFHLAAPLAPADAGWKTSDGSVTFDFRHEQRDGWAAFCRHIGLASIVDDPAYRDWRSTIFTGPRRHDLGQVYRPFFESHTSAVVAETITRFGGISVKLQSHDELFAHPQLQAMSPFVFIDERPQLGLPFAPAHAVRRAVHRVAGEFAGWSPRRPSWSEHVSSDDTGRAVDGKPLRGLRVVDATVGGVGPWAGSLLGMLGADVVKIESPQGDFIRNILPTQGGLSTTYIALNTNKRGVAVDLRDPQERASVLELVAGADVFLENFRTGTAEKLGIGYEALSSINARLVYLSASGFGRTGPLATLGATDPHLQAFSGLAALNGTRQGDEQLWRWYGHVDVTSAMCIVQAVLVALWQRRGRGVGALLQVSMLESALSLQRAAIALWAEGVVPRPMGSACAYLAPDEAFEAADEPVAISVVRERQWPALCEVLGLQALVADERFASNAARVTRRDELASLIVEVTRTRPAWYWVERLQALGVPSARFVKFADFRHHAHYRHNGMVQQIDAPTEGRVWLGGSPWEFAGASCDPKTGPRPGQHSELLRGGGWQEPPWQ